MASTTDGVRERSDTGEPAWTGRLCRLLDRLHEQFAGLDALSAHQGPLVEADDPEPLLSLLAERQAVIEQIERTNQELDPLRAEWEKGADGLPGVLRAQIRARIERIAQIAAAVAARDGSDQARLVQRRDAVAGRLVEIGRGRGALAAYGGRRGGEGASFQDTEA